MRTISLLINLLLFILLPNFFTISKTYAQSAPSPKICRALRNWDGNRHLSPVKLCNDLVGDLCLDVKSSPEAICRGAHQNPCSLVKTDGEALCKILKLGNCSFYNERNAITKLRGLCHF